MSDNYQLAKEWLEQKYSDAHERMDVGEMLLIEWIIDTLYFDNDMSDS
jgi:hypothetical protein